MILFAIVCNNSLSINIFITRYCNTDFQDVITIEDSPWDRAVQVTVIAPEGTQITVDGITVKVRAFGR